MAYTIKLEAVVLLFILCSIICFMVGWIASRAKQHKIELGKVESVVSKLKINEEKRRTNYMSMYSLGYCAAIKDFESILKECDDL